MATMNATGHYVFISFTGNPVTVFDLVWLPLLVILGLAEVVLNVIVLRALRRHVLNSDVSHYFIFNLAIADACVGVFVVYNSLYTLLEWKLLTECLLRFGLMLAFNMASVLIMAMMTVDRYVKVRFPFRHQHVFRPKAIVTASLLVWLLSLAFGLMPALGWNRGAHLVETECMFFGVLSESYLIVVMVIFLVPFVVMVLLYSHIFLLARQHARAIFLQLRSFSKVGLEASSWRSARTLGILIGVYVVCWSPIGGYFLAVLLLRESLESAGVPLGTVLTAVAGISFLNSLINPLIYAAKVPAVNAQFRKLCCRKRKSKSAHGRASSVVSVLALRTLATGCQKNASLPFRRCESETALAKQRVATQTTLVRCGSELVNPTTRVCGQTSLVSHGQLEALPSGGRDGRTSRLACDSAGSHPSLVGSHPSLVGSHPYPVGSHPCSVGSHLCLAGSHSCPAGSAGRTLALRRSDPFLPDSVSMTFVPEKEICNYANEVFLDNCPGRVLPTNSSANFVERWDNSGKCSSVRTPSTLWTDGKSPGRCGRSRRAAEVDSQAGAMRCELGRDFLRSLSWSASEGAVCEHASSPACELPRRLGRPHSFTAGPVTS